METPELCSKSVRPLGGLGVSALPAPVWIEGGLKKTLHQNFDPTLGTYSEYWCCWPNRNIYENGRQKLVRYGRAPKAALLGMPSLRPRMPEKRCDSYMFSPKWAPLPKGQNENETLHPDGPPATLFSPGLPSPLLSHSFKKGHFLKDSLVAVE